MIRSLNHFKAKERIFNRKFNEFLDKYKEDILDKVLLQDCWYLSNELLLASQNANIFDTQLKRESIQHSLISKRRFLLDMMPAKLRFKIGLYI